MIHCMTPVVVNLVNLVSLCEPLNASNAAAGHPFEPGDDVHHESPGRAAASENR